MTVALLLIGITWAVRTAASLWCMVAFMTIWAFLYQLSIGACGYSVAAEAPAARLRSPTIGLAQALAQICAWVMGFATPYVSGSKEET
jgi:SP family general alpha glucoside:H+ symporter-like MFS transporter